MTGNLIYLLCVAIAVALFQVSSLNMIIGLFIFLENKYQRDILTNIIFISQVHFMWNTLQTNGNKT